MVLDERQDLPFSIARIVLDAPTTAGPSALEAVRKRAESIAAQARAGADFAALARRYSNEAKASRRGSVVGPLGPGQLPAALDRVATNLEVGEVSNPVRVGSTLVVLKLVARQPSRLPTYEEAAVQLQERAYMEKMNRARKQWLSGLRRQMHVEVRL